MGIQCKPFLWMPFLLVFSRKYIIWSLFCVFKLCLVFKTVTSFHYFIPNFMFYKIGFLPKRAFHCTRLNSLKKNELMINQQANYLIIYHEAEKQLVQTGTIIWVILAAGWRIQDDHSLKCLDMWWRNQTKLLTSLSLSFPFWKWVLNHNNQWF